MTTGTEATTPTGASEAPEVALDASRHARRAWLLLAIGAFQVWLWTTRLVNLAGDPEPRSTGFVVVHALLYAAAFAAAGVLLVLGWRMRRESAASRGEAAGHDAPVASAGSRRAQESER